MSQIQISLQFARFNLQEKPAAGLFVLFCAATQGEKEPPDPALISLGFVSGFGVLHDASQVTNPWFLYTSTSVQQAESTKAGAPPIGFLASSYLFCFVAHPSPEVAKDYLERARTGKPMPNGKVFAWHPLTPAPKIGTLAFALPTTADAYVPGGPAGHGGWLLYYRMPYAALVKEHALSLAQSLGGLKYPVTGSGGTHPYEAAADGFTIPLFAALVRFQDDAKQGRAFKFDASAIEKYGSWACLFGSPATPAPATAIELGLVDEATCQALMDWQAQGLINPGKVLVANGKLWTQPEYWFRHKALNLVCEALGALYEIKEGSSYRDLMSSGLGQAEQSKHKIGMACDLESALGEVSSLPLAYEGEWQLDQTKKYRPVWLVFAHSTAPLDSDIKTKALDEVTTKLTAYIKGMCGTADWPLAQAVLSDVNDTVEKLKVLAATPSAVARSELSAQYLRSTIRRFQWRANEPDGGDVQLDVSAVEDAKNHPASQIAPAKAQAVKSWLNVTRLAYDLKLYRVPSRSEFTTVGYVEQMQKYKRPPVKLDIHIAKGGFRSMKAYNMDYIADSIEAKPDEPVHITGKAYTDTAKSKTPGKKYPAVNVTVPASQIDLDVLRDWMTRPSDDPQSHPEAQLGFDFATNGIDLTMDVIWTGNGSAEQIKFLQSRAALAIQVLEVGDGLEKTGLEAGKTRQVGDILNAITQNQPVPSSSANPYRIVMRPVVVKDPSILGDRDPGTLSYGVWKIAEEKGLEWWHLELTFGGVDWVTHADAFGYHREVLTAPSKVLPSSPGPYWQGGAGIDAKAPTNTPERPSAKPNLPELPVT